MAHTAAEAVDRGAGEVPAAASSGISAVFETRRIGERQDVMRNRDNYCDQHRRVKASSVHVARDHRVCPSEVAQKNNTMKCGSVLVR
jgi:hypothetical protein